jgi:hypothetical protein
LLDHGRVEDGKRGSEQSRQDRVFDREAESNCPDEIECRRYTTGTTRARAPRRSAARIPATRRR